MGGGPLLEADRLDVLYGDYQILWDARFRAEAGEVVALLGPTGAGKSTLFDLLTGFQAPDEGRILLDGESIAGLSPDRISRRGIGRTFQKLRPFGHMTVLENVMVGAFQKTTSPREAREQAQRALESVGLADRAQAHARVLSTGQRKRLEMARALATRPRLLLLDEITGGVDQRSIPGLVELVQRLHAGGTALVVIEHNMRVIMGISQRVVALHLGEVIRVGPPAAVTGDPRVIEAYLGRAYAP